MKSEKEMLKKYKTQLMALEIKTSNTHIAK